MMVDAIMPVWAVALAVALIALVMVYLETLRQAPYRTIRLTCVLFMLTALTIILLRPKYRVTDSSKILLLTEDYRTKSVDSLLENSAYTLRHFEKARPYRGSSSLSAADIAYSANRIAAVVGNGLPHSALDKMPETAHNFAFFPSTLPAGITAMTVAPCIANRECDVSGTLVVPQQGTLYLEGPGGLEDSLHFSTAGTHHFIMKFFPKQAGNFTYAIELKNRAETVREPLPVVVHEGKPMKVLILQQHPSFEYNSLKNFLEKRQHQVVARYKVSKTAFRFEYINHEQINAGRITPELLATFDLLLSDSPTLEALPRGEQTAISNAIHAGLGLLNIGPATSGKQAKVFFPFQVVPAGKDTIQKIIKGNRISLGTASFRVGKSPENVSIETDGPDVLSGYTTVGLGKIGFQLLQQTFPVMLSGDSTSYSRIWTPLLERVARSIPEPTRISIVTPFPWYEQEPIDIQLISSSDKIPQITSDSIVLPLREDTMIDNVWYTRSWAGKPGWHRLEGADGSNLNYWIANPNEWKSLSVATQIRGNTLRSADNQMPEGKGLVNWKTFPGWIAYVLFLLSAGVLWLAPKL
jgi:hypothetical protein